MEAPSPCRQQGSPISGLKSRHYLSGKGGQTILHWGRQTGRQLGPAWVVSVGLRPSPTHAPKQHPGSCQEMGNGGGQGRRHTFPVLPQADRPPPGTTLLEGPSGPGEDTSHDRHVPRKDVASHSRAPGALQDPPLPWADKIMLGEDDGGQPRTPISGRHRPPDPPIWLASGFCEPQAHPLPLLSLFLKSFFSYLMPHL